MITGVYAALIALIFITLSVRVILYRRKNQIGLGDHGDKSLMKRMRAQANCAEYAPFGLLLMLMVEFTDGDWATVHAIGILLLAGRLVHGYGFSTSPPIMLMRQAGMLMTFAAYLVAIIALLLPPYAPY